MSTHVPGFLSYFFLYHFVLGKYATSSISVNIHFSVTSVIFFYHNFEGKQGGIADLCGLKSA